jgi:hypothetical protein
MALRMVLVGVVAGLGLTLPTGRQFTSWKDSAQSWASARLAAWDAQMPADENAFVLVVEPASIAADSVSAPRAVASAGERPAADAPKTVVSAPATPTPTSALTGENDPKTTPTDLAVGLETPTSPMPLTESEAVEPALSLSTLDSAFGIAQNEVVSAFAADEKAIVAVNPPTPAPAPVFEPLEVGDNLYEGLAYELNREAEGMSLPREEVARFEPLDVADDLYAGVAYALNREAEGLEVPAQSDPPRPTMVRLEDMRPATRDSRLTHAVRLTRDAVYAWANLLHGPAVVTIAH